MITELTTHQAEQMQVYTDKWIEVGLSCEPINEHVARQAIIKAYEAAGLPAPTRFYTVPSPTAAIKLIKTLDPTEKTENIISEFVYGCHEAGWLSYYEYYKDVCDIDLGSDIANLITYSKHAGWVSLYEDVVVMQDRPEHIKFDDQRRTHCENDAAIKYRDGTGVYVWHGVRIPEEWITNKETLAAKTALTWKNIEQRRAACEIIGWVNVLRELNARTIDTDSDPMIGTLLEVDIPDIGLEKFLKVRCGTGREFALPVPPEMTTALQANAWTYDISEDLLKTLEVRT